jgi:hypothetical protein
VPSPCRTGASGKWWRCSITLGLVPRCASEALGRFGPVRAAGVWGLATGGLRPPPADYALPATLVAGLRPEGKSSLGILHSAEMPRGHVRPASQTVRTEVRPKASDDSIRGHVRPRIPALSLLGPDGAELLSFAGHWRCNQKSDAPLYGPKYPAHRRSAAGFHHRGRPVGWPGTPGAQNRSAFQPFVSHLT